MSSFNGAAGTLIETEIQVSMMQHFGLTRSSLHDRSTFSRCSFRVLAILCAVTFMTGCGTEVVEEEEPSYTPTPPVAKADVVPGMLASIPFSLGVRHVQLDEEGISNLEVHEINTKLPNGLFRATVSFDTGNDAADDPAVSDIVPVRAKVQITYEVRPEKGHAGFDIMIYPVTKVETLSVGPIPPKEDEKKP